MSLDMFKYSSSDVLSESTQERVVVSRTITFNLTGAFSNRAGITNLWINAPYESVELEVGSQPIDKITVGNKRLVQNDEGFYQIPFYNFTENRYFPVNLLYYMVLSVIVTLPSDCNVDVLKIKYTNVNVSNQPPPNSTKMDGMYSTTLLHGDKQEVHDLRFLSGMAGTVQGHQVEPALSVSN